MKRALLVPTLALALLVPAAAQAASLPKPATSLVAVPTSIAGIKLGMAEAKARAAWGGGRGECSKFAGGTQGRCEYGSSTGSGGSASLSFRDGKVSTVVVSSGRRADGTPVPSAAAPLAAIKTSAGIGIGAKLAKLKAAYPQGEVYGSSSESSFSYVVGGQGKASFGFTLAGASKKVVQMLLDDGREA